MIILSSSSHWSNPKSTYCSKDPALSHAPANKHILFMVPKPLHPPWWGTGHLGRPCASAPKPTAKALKAQRPWGDPDGLRCFRSWLVEWWLIWLGWSQNFKDPSSGYPFWLWSSYEFLIQCSSGKVPMKDLDVGVLLKRQYVQIEKANQNQTWK